MKILPLLCIPLVVGTGAVISSNVKAPSNEQIERNVTRSNFNEYEEYGSTYNVPEIEKDGVKLNSVCIFPDGSATNLKSFVLEQAGFYQIKYNGEINGKVYSENHSFIVKNQYFSLTSTNSFASYETSDRTYGQEGLFVNLHSGDSISFNETIDLRSTTINDSIIRLFAAPKDIGKMDFTGFELRLTDVEDSSNVLLIRYKASGEGVNAPYSYVDAGATGQDMVGVENGTKIHTNSAAFGTSITHSFYGQYNSTSQKIGNICLDLQYLAQEKQLYCNTGHNFISDLDSSKYYTKIWDGFKSGLVKLSLTAVGNSASDARFVIKSIRDLDLSLKTIDDSTPPVISVDNPYKTLPSARVGNVYPIFNAVAFDNLSGAVSVDTKVYYVKDGNRFNVSIIEGEGRYFSTSKAGQYEIVYTAKDAVQNVSKETLVVNTSNSIPEIVIQPYGTPLDEINRGNRYYFPRFQVTGGSGNLESYFEVTFNGKQIEINDDYFIPREVGDYKVTYHVCDITLEEETYIFNVFSEAHKGGAFEDVPQMPKYFISGFQNQVPMLYGFDYGQGGKQVVADVKVSYDDQVLNLKAGDKFKPTIQSERTNIKFVYSCKDATLEYEVPCLNVYNDDKTLAIGKYFVKENCTISTSYDDSTDKAIVRSTVNGNFNWDFASKLPSNSASIQLQFLKNESKFNELDVVLTDFANPEEKVTIKLQNVKNATEDLLVKCGDEVIKTDLSFISDEKFTVSYRYSKFYLNSASAQVLKFDNGKEFTGFSSNFVYISMIGVGAEIDSGYFIKTIGNQPISQIRTDLFDPLIEPIDNYGGFALLNEEVSTARIIYCDVLDPNVTAKLTVKDPDKQIVKDINGVELINISPDQNYNFLTSKYGTYSLIYTVEDSRNESSFSYSIGVLDNIAPEIKLNSDYNTSCKVGELILIPKFTVTDNIENKIIVYVSIKNPYGSMYNVSTDFDSIKATAEGVYVITITAIDETGNVSQVTWNVTVSK